MADAGTIELLPWDSQHFERTVARLRERVLAAAQLSHALEQAKAQGVSLLYWLAEHDLAVPAELLQRFGGLRVIGHVRYERSLTGADRDADALQRSPVVEYRGEPADEAKVVQLGIAAGILSRFRADPRLPAEKCDALYESWIRRSVRHELADVVLIVRRGGSAAGLLTLSARDAIATIGLVATDPAQRGTGIGTSLLAAGHAWARAHGAERIEVATQSENRAACRLYERAGYSAAQRGDYYHFML